jgi:hypothetical protein
MKLDSRLKCVKKSRGDFFLLNNTANMTSSSPLIQSPIPNVSNTFTQVSFQKTNNIDNTPNTVTTKSHTNNQANTFNTVFEYKHVNRLPVVYSQNGQYELNIIDLFINFTITKLITTKNKPFLINNITSEIMNNKQIKLLPNNFNSKQLQSVCLIVSTAMQNEERIKFITINSRDYCTLRYPFANYVAVVSSSVINSQSRIGGQKQLIQVPIKQHISQHQFQSTENLTNLNVNNDMKADHKFTMLDW